jgi:hypothetical protein
MIVRNGRERGHRPLQGPYPVPARQFFERHKPQPMLFA